jgi:hypothetical protein
MARASLSWASSAGAAGSVRWFKKSAIYNLIWQQAAGALFWRMLCRHKFTS